MQASTTHTTHIPFTFNHSSSLLLLPLFLLIFDNFVVNGAIKRGERQKQRITRERYLKWENCRNAVTFYSMEFAFVLGFFLFTLDYSTNWIVVFFWKLIWPGRFNSVLRSVFRIISMWFPSFNILSLTQTHINIAGIRDLLRNEY